MAKGDIPNTNSQAPMSSMGQKMQPTGNPGAFWQNLANSNQSYPMGHNPQMLMGNMMNQSRFGGGGMNPSIGFMQRLMGGMGMQGGGQQIPNGGGLQAPMPQAPPNAGLMGGMRSTPTPGMME